MTLPIHCCRSLKQTICSGHWWDNSQTEIVLKWNTLLSEQLNNSFICLLPSPQATCSGTLPRGTHSTSSCLSQPLLSEGQMKHWESSADLQNLKEVWESYQGGQNFYISVLQINNRNIIFCTALIRFVVFQSLCDLGKPVSCNYGKMSPGQPLVPSSLTTAPQWSTMFLPCPPYGHQFSLPIF